MKRKRGERLLPFTDRLGQLPWWALAAALIGVILAWQMANDETYEVIFARVANGIQVTLFVTFVSYTFAVLLGLLIAFGRLSKNVVLYQVSTFYVEIVRGLPTLVLLLYVAYVVIPGIMRAINVPTRAINELARVIIALVIAYSPFISEIFRAGIESIDRGQMEASRALGMNYWQAMRYIILPQAIRNVLPALGNDFIAMLKDSSLVSVLGVTDITNLGQNYASSTFRYLQTYNVVAFLYLTMTLLLSMVVRWIERYTQRDRTK